MTMTIRAYRQGDEVALYDVCLRTGADGEDASALYQDPSLLGEVYVGPYLSFAPGLSFVAEDNEGVGGYALGALDTAAFEAACESSWWPPLRRRYPRTEFGHSADSDVVRVIHEPPTTPAGLVKEYPAHVHIDLLPRFQGQSYGGRMMRILFDSLARAGARGVHLESHREIRGRSASTSTSA